MGFDERLRRRRRGGLALVLVVAAVLRVLVYVEIAAGPWPHLHVWSQSDMHFFDRWAKAITAGDLLTADDMRPYHGRHRKMACAALASASAGAAACTDERIRAMWDAWVGPHTFWQDPLYPYSMAAAYAVVGPASGPQAVQVGQALLGLASVALVYLIALRLFGPTAAVAAGLMAALFGPLLMYETVLLRAVPIAFCGLLACWLLTTAADRAASARRVFVAGLVSGALCLLKMSALLTVAAWALLPAMRSRTSGWLPAIFLAGVLLAFVPLAARNAVIGAPLLQGASTGWLNFVNGNAADRTVGAGSAVSGLAVPILLGSGGRGPATVGATIRSHGSTADWLALLAAKLVAFFDAREIPNNVNYRYFLLQAPGVAAVAIGFPIVLGFAVVGALQVARSRRSEVWFPVAYVAAGIATCVLFFNLSRFRLPIAMMLMPIAGAGYSFIAERLRERDWPRMTSAAAVAAAVALSAVLLSGDDGAVRIADYGVANEISEHLARREAASGKVDEAVARLERQLQTEPFALRRIEAGSKPTRVPVELSGIAGTFVGLHELLSELAAASGRAALASEQAERAAVLRALHRPYESAVRQ